jgi:hypothetical protein
LVHAFTAHIDDGTRNFAAPWSFLFGVALRFRRAGVVAGPVVASPSRGTTERRSVVDIGRSEPGAGIWAASAALVVALLWLLVFPAGAGAGLFREPGPGGATCAPNPTPETPSACTPVAPDNDRVAIFDSYSTTVGNPLKGRNRTEINTAKQAFESEHYTVREDEGPDAYHAPLLSSFVAIAKSAPGVLFITSHGFAPGSASRDCSAAKILMRAYGNHHPAARLSPSEPVVCRDEAGLAVQPEPSYGAMDRAYKRYLAAGYSDDWIEPIKSRSLLGTDVGYLVLTAEGIKHFFGAKHLALVIDDACHSMAFFRDFNALSYLGYSSTACDREDVVDIPRFLRRLQGKAGIDYRTTTAAYLLKGFKSPVISLAYQKPVVLSPAVESVSPQPGSALPPSGAPVAGAVQFDAAMDTTNTAGVVTATGCGASVTNERWASDDPTLLEFDLNVPANSSGGMITLTAHNTAAVANSGGFPNEQLDGNTGPTGDSGVAPNGNDYVWQVSCPSGAFHLSGNVATTLVLDSSTTCNNGFTNPNAIQLFMTPTGQPATPPQEDSDLDISLSQNGTTTFPNSDSAGDLAYLPNGSVPNGYYWGDLEYGQPDTEGTVTIQDDGSSGSVSLTFPAIMDGKQGQASSPETIVGSWDCNSP